eukprot:scaffold596715_cov32-Prasinocladus_malaysianus.AAC.2
MPHGLFAVMTKAVPSYVANTQVFHSFIWLFDGTQQSIPSNCHKSIDRFMASTATDVAVITYIDHR